MGIKQSLQQCALEEIPALLEKGRGYQYAPAKTVRRWQRIAISRTAAPPAKPQVIEQVATTSVTTKPQLKPKKKWYNKYVK